MTAKESMTNSKQSLSVEELRQKLRMIVSHATGGSSQDIDASVNDICVLITQNVNRVWAHAQESALRSRSPLEDNSNG